MSANWYYQRPIVKSPNFENIQSYFNRGNTSHSNLTFVRNDVKDISLSGQTYSSPLGHGIKAVFSHLRNYEITNISGKITIGYPFANEPIGQGYPFKNFTPEQVLKKQAEIYTPAKLEKIERDLNRMNSALLDGVFILGDSIYVVIGYLWWSNCVQLKFAS